MKQQTGKEGKAGTPTRTQSLHCWSSEHRETEKTDEAGNVSLLQEHGLCSEEWLSIQEDMQLSKEGTVTKRGRGR